MKLTGIIPARNEDWCLALTTRTALEWCDSLVVLDHASTDDTHTILVDLHREYPGRVEILSEPDPVYHEMLFRQRMLEWARRHGSTHIAIADADEILTSNLIGSVRSLAESTSPGCILELPGYNLRGSIDRYHLSGIWGNRWFSLVFPDHSSLGWSGDCFHKRKPQGMNLTAYQPLRQGQGGVFHLWGLSERRLRAKHAWYKMTERLRWPEKPVAEIEFMYSQAFANSQSWVYAATPREWWIGYDKWMQYLKADSEPWQEKQCKAWWTEHGAERFRGLDLFGIV